MERLLAMVERASRITRLSQVEIWASIKNDVLAVKVSGNDGEGELMSKAKIFTREEIDYFRNSTHTLLDTMCFDFKAELEALQSEKRGVDSDLHKSNKNNASKNKSDYRR